MDSKANLVSTFDKTILVGLGCGVIVLCVIAGWSVYIVGNLLLPAPASTQAAQVPVFTLTPGSPTLESPTVTPLPLTEALPPTLIPSPLPTFGGNSNLTGKIVFVCYVKQIDQICLMNADGSAREQLTDFTATAFYPSLSPDGGTVFFSSKRSGGFEIYSIGINGKGLQRLTREIGSLYAPELSPGGEWVLFTNNGNGLWLMKPDGGNPHPLTTRDDIDPTWSPNGALIAFASSRSGARQLFVMNADGSNVRQVTDLKEMGGRSTWSPDGSRLAFYRGPAGDHDVYLINIDGTGLERLTNGGDNLGPSWSPDGNWIAFTSFRDGNNEIYIIRPDGTGLRRLTENKISDWQPRWGR
jgi:Tol biopolymer transport system component